MNHWIEKNNDREEFVVKVRKFIADSRIAGMTDDWIRQALREVIKGYDLDIDEMLAPAPVMMWFGAALGKSIILKPSVLTGDFKAASYSSEASAEIEYWFNE